MFLPGKENVELNARRKSKIEKKNDSGFPQGVSNFTDTYVPRVEICNEITTSFQIYKKVSTTTPYILFYLPNGGKLSKMLLLKSILAFFYHFNLTD